MRPYVLAICGLAPLLTAVTFLGAGSPPAPPGESNLKLEALLIWGTNDGKSPNPKHKPVEAEVRKKLQELPLKWTNYFVVNRKVLELPPKGTNKTALSDKYEIEVKNRGGSNFEFSSFGKGKSVGKRTQPLPKNETLILGGNDKGGNTWLVVLKRLE
jgi:hypothetical protein